MHLLEPALQPVELGRRYASLRTTTGARCVEGDESHRGCVVDVIRGGVANVLLRESVALRLVAGLQVRVNEFAQHEVTPIAVSSCSGGTSRIRPTAMSSFKKASSRA